MLKIGIFSKLSRVSIRMLRHYDELGLLRPVRIDPETGYRYYSESQLRTATRIAAYKEMGFGLAAIGELLACSEDRAALTRNLERQRAVLEAQARQTAYRLRLLETALEWLRKDAPMMNIDVTLKTFPARYAATVRQVLPSYEHEGRLWQTIHEETAGLNLVRDTPCYCCVVYWDKEYREANVDVEAQMTVKGRYPDTTHIRFRPLPEVTVASATYQGPYEQLNEPMAAVAQWVADNGYELDGPTFNIYHVAPHETSDPNDYVTEICCPVRKK